MLCEFTTEELWRKKSEVSPSGTASWGMGKNSGSNWEEVKELVVVSVGILSEGGREILPDPVVPEAEGIIPRYVRFTELSLCLIKVWEIIARYAVFVPD